MARLLKKYLLLKYRDVYKINLLESEGVIAWH